MRLQPVHLCPGFHASLRMVIVRQEQLRADSTDRHHIEGKVNHFDSMPGWAIRYDRLPCCNCFTNSIGSKPALIRFEVRRPVQARSPRHGAALSCCATGNRRTKHEENR